MANKVGDRVEAQLDHCPDRTLWELRADGQWHCLCPGAGSGCGERSTIELLVNPVRQ